jgi:hypothetical protein
MMMLSDSESNFLHLSPLAGKDIAFVHASAFSSLPPRAQRVVGRVDARRRQASGWGEFPQGSSPHPGLCFASAFPPHRFAGGGTKEYATKFDCLPGKWEEVTIPPVTA